MRLKKIIPNRKSTINVIIETPHGSQNKLAYDPQLKVFKLKKTLPLGSVFPFDFGFIPNTKGQDGDPLDVLVIMEQPAYPGCLVECRLIGILEATQKEKKGGAIRNDRIVAISKCSVMYCDIRRLSELNKNMVDEIEKFFIGYNEQEGKKFTPIKWSSAKEALKVITKCKK